MERFLAMMEDLLRMTVKLTHLSPLAVKGIAVALLLLFLLYAVRNPGKGLKLFVVVLIFIALGYAAYGVIDLGAERSREIERNQPGLSPE